MDTFMLCPLQEGYSFTPGNNVREQALEGGMPRQVIKFLGAVHTANVSVFLEDPRARQYFWAFWRINQTRTWKWKLSLDEGVLEDCECKFTSNSLPQESMRDGKILKVSFQVLVRPVSRNPRHDRAILDLWHITQPEAISEFEKIPNEWLPNATGVENGTD